MPPAPQTTSERDRTERRKNTVFVVSMLGGLLTLFAGFSFAFAACARSLDSAINSAFSGFNLAPSFKADVQPIAIPQSACPSLRVVSVAAKDAAAPWAQVFDPAIDPTEFSKRLAAPLASLDGALGAAVDHVPGPVASDLRTVREKVESGRLQLPVKDSVMRYLDRSGVVDGYSTLQHASALVGNACGFVLAPPIPF
jgi:hypothetical protein